MGGHRLYLVDVFAEARYAGNQLAVVTHAADLGGDRMQAIAREMNFSETSFVLHDAERDGAFDTRIFTPHEEVPFAGHPTLGTAWVIRHELLAEPREKIVLRTGVGPIEVAFERAADALEVLWMHQRAPEFGAGAGVAELAAVLGLDAAAFDARMPVQEVSTGLPCWIVPLVDLAAVRRCRVDAPAYAEFVRERAAKAILVFARETCDPANQIHARMFAGHYGVPEDPATGSANGCLAAYLVEHAAPGADALDVRVEQGIEIGRPSLLRLRAWKRGGRIEVFVGGRVIPVARGELL